MSCPRCDYVAELALHTADTIREAILPETPPHHPECRKAMQSRAEGAVVNSQAHYADAYATELLRGVLVGDSE